MLLHVAEKSLAFGHLRWLHQAAVDELASMEPKVEPQVIPPPTYPKPEPTTIERDQLNIERREPLKENRDGA